MRRYRATNADRPLAIGFTADTIIVTLANGTVLRCPLATFAWLQAATPEQRLAYELLPDSIYWPEWDDGIDLEWLRQEQQTMSDDSHEIESITIVGGDTAEPSAEWWQTAMNDAPISGMTRADLNRLIDERVLAQLERIFDRVFERLEAGK